MTKNSKSTRGKTRIEHKSPPLSALVTLFVADRKARGCTISTQTFYTETLALFLAFCDTHGHLTAADLTPDVVRAYFGALRDRTLKPLTVRVYARPVKTFARWLYAEELVETEIMRNVPLPKAPKQILPSLSTDDVTRLLAACHTRRTRALVMVLLDSGVRVAELCALTVADVDLKTGAVRVRHGKGEKDRVTWLGVAARKAVMLYLAHAPAEANDVIFRSERGGARLLPNGVRQILTRLGKAAGVKHCNPHMFRRTFALTCLRNGMNVFVLARMMGHADLDMLKQYLAIVDGDAQDAHAAASPVDGLRLGRGTK